MESLIKYELCGGVATIAMDDGKANVMGRRMLQAINAALDRAQAEQAAVVLTGRSGVFSGGFDLAVFKTDQQELIRMLEAGALLTERLLSFPRPVLAACTGHAIAMGAFLLLSADVRIGADQDARIQVNEVEIGLTLPRFAIEICRQRLSPAHLNRAAVTAEPYSVHQAVLAGFLDEIVPAESLQAIVHSRAARLAKLHAASFAATKLRLRQQTLEALRAAIRDDVADWTLRLRKQG